MEKMMDHQYMENGARNIYSNYNQMRAYVEFSPNQSKKLYLIDLSIEQSTKLLRLFYRLEIAPWNLKLLAE